LYGFRRITQGPDAGAYYHELFLRGRPALSQRMIRQKVKGTGHKQPADAKTEPNFYLMSPVLDSTFEVPTSSQIASSAPTSPMLPILPTVKDCQKPFVPLTPSDRRRSAFRKEASTLPPSGLSRDDIDTSLRSPIQGRRNAIPDFAPGDISALKTNYFLPDDIVASPGLRNAAYLLRGIAAGTRVTDQPTGLSIPTDEEKHEGSFEQHYAVIDARGSSSSAESSNYNTSFRQSLQPRFSASEFRQQYEDGGY
jgi:hypothetical protein